MRMKYQVHIDNNGAPFPKFRRIADARNFVRRRAGRGRASLAERWCEWTDANPTIPTSQLPSGYRRVSSAHGWSAYVDGASLLPGRRVVEVWNLGAHEGCDTATIVGDRDTCDWASGIWTWAGARGSPIDVTQPPNW